MAYDGRRVAAVLGSGGEDGSEQQEVDEWLKTGLEPALVGERGQHEEDQMSERLQESVLGEEGRQQLLEAHMMEAIGGVYFRGRGEAAGGGSGLRDIGGGSEAAVVCGADDGARSEGLF